MTEATAEPSFLPNLSCTVCGGTVTSYAHTMKYQFYDSRRIGPPLSTVKLSCGCEFLSPKYMEKEDCNLMAIVDKLNDEVIIQWEERRFSDEYPFG